MANLFVDLKLENFPHFVQSLTQGQVRKRESDRERVKSLKTK